MHSSSYSYHSSDSVFSNTMSTQASLDSNENFLSVNCGPTLINSCISFSTESVGGHRYWAVGMGLCFTFGGQPFSRMINSVTSKGKALFYFVSFFFQAGNVAADCQPNSEGQRHWWRQTDSCPKCSSVCKLILGVILIVVKVLCLSVNWNFWITFGQFLVFLSAVI